MPFSAQKRQTLRRPAPRRPRGPRSSRPRPRPRAPPPPPLRPPVRPGMISPPLGRLGPLLDVPGLDVDTEPFVVLVLAGSGRGRSFVARQDDRRRRRVLLLAHRDEAEDGVRELESALQLGDRRGRAGVLHQDVVAAPLLLDL